MLIKTLTPVITAGAYSAGDQLGSVNVLQDVVEDQRSCVLLVSLILLDKSKQNAGLVALFFDDAPTLASADGDALSISDSEMASKCIGAVEIEPADYIDIGNSSVVSLAKLELLLRSNTSYNKSGEARTGEVWCVLMTSGTPTYASTSDLTLKFGLEQY
jgi:hypothetical protein